MRGNIIKPKDIARFQRFPDIGNLELLHASYHRQTFSPHFHEGHAIGVIGKVRDPVFSEKIRTLHQDFENPLIPRLEKESRFFSIMAGFIIKHAVQKAVPKAPGSEKNRVRKIKDYIQDHYDTDVSLDELSRTAGISRYYLLRMFERETGLTPHTYLNLVRVKRAREFMAQGVTIIEAAHGTGFFDQSHLNRVFKKFYGITPGQFCEKKERYGKNRT